MGSVEKAVTRFAPSPTGYLHVGGLRSALYNYLWARHTGGKFHLRIEDTDRSRLVEDAEEQIKQSLQWLGLQWDDKIVYQSERKDIYLKRALEIVKAGKAYIANDSPEIIKKTKEDWNKLKPVGRPPIRYPSRSNPIDPEDYDSGKGQVIRYRWPDQPPSMSVRYFDTPRDPGVVSFDVKAAPSAFEDFVLIKSDGYPTYNFAHIIDDHDQGITHVIRGDEFTSSSNKYQQLYEDFKWVKPIYIHIPPILGPQGTKKLSKRDGARDALEYRKLGFLPEALANFIALIGWSPGDDREFFGSLDELADAFSLQRVQKSPGQFDEAKLRWLNREHLKQLDTGALIALTTEQGFWKPSDDPAYDTQVLALAVERAETLADLSAVREGYFYHRPSLTAKQLVGNEPLAEVATWLERTNRELPKVEEWRGERLQNALTDIREELGLVPKQLFPVLREALTGSPQTPALWDLMAVFGKGETLARLEAAQSLVA